MLRWLCGTVRLWATVLGPSVRFARGCADQPERGDGQPSEPGLPERAPFGVSVGVTRDGAGHGSYAGVGRRRHAVTEVPLAATAPKGKFHNPAGFYVRFIQVLCCSGYYRARNWTDNLLSPIQESNLRCGIHSSGIET